MKEEEKIINTGKQNKAEGSESKKDFTSFGNKTVEKEERQNLVNSVFSNVASSYDVMNDAMSCGVHRIWKNEFVNMLGLMKPNMVFNEEGSNEEKLKILDVAGGTGDIAFRIHERAKNYAKSYFTEMPVEITVADINPEMLEVGKSRAKEYNIPETEINWREGNAESLNFIKDDSVDIYTIAFGIRNCTNLDKVLQESHRILKKGGRFMCLEFSHIQLPVISSLYDLYSFYVIPELGHLIANDRKSYEYLVESIRKFPDQETFKKLIEDSGFQSANYVNFSGGIVAVHSGVKL